MFEIGDKVRLKQEEIDYYWNNPDEGWVDDSDEVFRSGRVFLVTDKTGGDIELDGDDVGWWPSSSFILAEELPGDLFEI